MTDKPIEPPRDSLGRLVTVASARSLQILSKFLEPYELSPQQWIVLGVLWRRDNVTVGEIARYMRSERPAVSRIVDRMHKAGWLDKTPSTTDARSTLVSASQKGREVEHLSALYTDVNDVLLDGFDEKEEKMLFDLLNRVRENATSYLAKA